MTEDELAHIEHYTRADIESTGATLASVQPQLITALDHFCNFYGCSFLILKNGLTTGKHSSVFHGIGLAADVVANHAEFLVQKAVKAALDAGFHGIGIYWNQVCYSMHLDLRTHYGFWCRARERNKTQWYEWSLILDPRAKLEELLSRTAAIHNHGEDIG